MKVAFLLTELRPDGIAFYCARLARALPCEVVLVVSAIALPDEQASSWILDSFDEIVVRETPLAASSLANVLTLARLLRAMDVDVVHVHELHLLKTVAPAARLARRPIVGTSHLGATGSDSWNRLAKRLFALGPSRLLCDLYIAISSDIAKELRQRYRVSPHRIRRVLMGVDLSQFRPPDSAERARARATFALPDAALVFVQIARLAEIKRPLDTLDAFEALLRRRPDLDARLAFAGDGPLRDTLEREIERRGLSGTASRLGFVDARDALWASDVLVLPSQVEGFGMVVVEAMACAVVPLRTRVEGWGDQIKDGENGYGVDVGDVQGLSERMERLCDPSVRAPLAAAAVAAARKRFDLRDTAAAVHRIYQELPDRGFPKKHWMGKRKRS